MLRKRLILCLTVSLLLFSFAGINSCGNKHNHSETEDVQGQKYYCPMHPSYTSNKPGSCPICGMDLVKAENKTPALGGEGVYISPERQQLIGVKLTKVSRRNLETLVRASGKVAHDIELYSAIVDYQVAFKSSSEISDQPNSSLISSIERLKHLGLSDAQIKRYSQTSESPSNLIMTNENGGTVWIYAQVYENEANLIKEGQLMEVTTSALPGKKFIGKVSSVGAYMTSETRSLLVRAEVSDPKGLLKPEMFADTVVHVAIGKKVAVPEEAVLDTGTRQLVFVNKGNGMYEPRKVTVGVHAEGYYEIIEGVSPGEEVVTSANFLIDSESRLKSTVK